MSVQLERVVEGDDRQHDPDGLADGEGHMSLAAGTASMGTGDRRRPLGLLAEAADDADRRIDLLACLEDGFAVLPG